MEWVTDPCGVNETIMISTNLGGRFMGIFPFQFIIHIYHIQGLFRKSPAIVNVMRMFVRHRCDLAAKESGLGCACVNNDFIGLVSWGR